MRAFPNNLPLPYIQSEHLVIRSPNHQDVSRHCRTSNNFRVERNLSAPLTRSAVQENAAPVHCTNGHFLGCMKGRWRCANRLSDSPSPTHRPIGSETENFFSAAYNSVSAYRCNRTSVRVAVAG